ncbi:DUF2845 domain-containing protein [Aquincola sp. MAHUQ-54]|uniref:DUF2845 domain-containing protein n=1 Tax=Aquincola agrisoli TaxID=3119538 RepID=A0AAW9QJD5_9BURK
MLALLAPAPAAAQSLRCNGQLVSTGESKVSVAAKCGDPLAREMVCVSRELFLWPLPAVPGQVLQPLITPGCVPMEEWTYHRGQGHFLAIVRFRNTAVDSIRDGERMP